MKSVFVHLVLIVLSALPVFGQEDAQNVLRLYDLRPILPAFDTAPWQVSMVVSPADSRGRELDPTSLDRTAERVGAETFVDLLTQMLGDELRYEGRQLALGGADQLHVLAPAGVHSAVQDALDNLATALSASSEIRVDVLTLEGGEGDWPANNVLDTEQADRLIAGLMGRGARQESHTLNLGAGRASWIDLQRGSPFVLDYDVEIAHGAAIYDPTVVKAQEGLLLLLRGVPTSDGVALSVVLRRSERLGDVQKRSLDLQGLIGSDQAGIAFLEGPQVLQTVKLQVGALAFDTFLPDGKVLLLATETSLGGSQRREYVFLRRSGGALRSFYSLPLKDSSRRLLLVNEELFNPPSVEFRQVPYVESPHHPLLAVRPAERSSLFLYDWLKPRFSVWRKVGPWAVVLSDPEWDGAAPDQLAQLVAGWRAETSLVGMEVSLQDVPRGGQGVRVSLPVRSGTEWAGVVGVTSTAILDFDVEVAQRAAVGDPVVRPVFSGLAGRFSPRIAKSGDIFVSAEGRARLVQGPVPTFDMEEPMMGSLDQPFERTMRVSERLRFSGSGGRPVRGILGDDSALRLEILVR